ncbi:MAG: immunoglobulin domain-containing protein [Planctomycetota bacterium]
MMPRFKQLAVVSALLGLAAQAQGQVLIASTSTAGGVSEIVGVDPLTGAVTPFMTVPVPAGFEVRYLATRPPCGLVGIVNRSDISTQRSRLLRIDPATKTSQLLEFTAPLNASYGEGVDWSPRHNAFMMGFTTFGSFGSNRLALFDENGVVSATSGALAVSDIDVIASSSTLDLIMDLNRASGTRVFNLTTLFPSPVASAYATPPQIALFWDAAIHPATGQVLLNINSGNQLTSLVGNGYVSGPAIQGGYILRGLAWVHMLPVISLDPQNTFACPSGTASMAVIGVFDEPATFRWQRESSPGNFIDLSDGSTSSWDGNQPGFGATISGSGTPSLSIAAAPGKILSPAHAVRYRCLISNPCGNATSNPARLVLCPADFNCDGALDFFDYDEFVVAFESGDLHADFDADGTVDFFDYDAFVVAFEAGC